MTTFIDEQVKSIDGRLTEIGSELRTLQAVRDILDGKPETAVATNGGTRRQRASEEGPRRQAQALALIEAKPGITSGELARAMNSGSYAYTLVGRLRNAGQIEPCDKGWRLAKA